MFEFRKGDETGTAVSTRGTAAIAIDTDGAWHTYTAYATVNPDAYDDCKELVPYVGWLGSETAGKIRIAGVTVRKVGDQWNDAMENFGFTASTIGAAADVEEVVCDDAPIAYQDTVKLAYNSTMYSAQVNAPFTSFPQPNATDTWTLSFWAKVNSAGGTLYHRTGQTSSPKSVWLTADDQWHYYSVPLVMTNECTFATMMLYFTLYPQSELYLNGMSLVPGSVALANDSHQNSAALKNISVCNNRFCFAAKYCGSHNRVAAQPSVLAVSATGGARYSVPSTQVRPNSTPRLNTTPTQTAMRIPASSIISTTAKRIPTNTTPQATFPASNSPTALGFHTPICSLSVNISLKLGT